MKQTIVLIFVLISFGGFSQRTTILEEISNENQNSFVSGNLGAHISLNDYNQTLFGIESSLSFISRRFEFVCRGRFHLADRMVDNALRTEVFSIYRPEKTRDFMANCSVALIEGEFDRKVQFHSNQSGVGLGASISVPAKVSNKLCLLTGFNMGSSYVNFNDLEYVGVAYDGSEKLFGQSLYSTYSPGDGSSFMDYINLEFGASFTSTTNVVFKTTSFNTISRKSIIQFYTKGILNLRCRMDDVFELNFYTVQQFLSTTYYEYHLRYEIDSNMPKRKLGFAAGFRTILIRTFGFNFGGEIGVLPGPNLSIRDMLHVDFNISMALGKEISAERPL
ncbi:MAG: hypothetical protein ACI857_003146 [Arenicella sp.]